MGAKVYLVEAAGRERSHQSMPLLWDLASLKGERCVFGQGPSNHQGRQGEGGDLG